ncbi:guanylate cyclase [Legionella steelei]|uniref:Guanylate cyclase n=1 Tax=Legionella steelei TaxID=947033 RepID=A0A0W0ZFC1_9GAMM|nr:guanylate cyclase [Legionella steelei]
MIVTLRMSMLFLFISLFVTTILLIILITTQRYSEALSDIAHQRMVNESLLILNRLHKNIGPAQIHSQFAARLIEEEDITHKFTTQIISLTTNIVKIIPLVVGAHWGDEKGNFIFAQKEPNGSITSDIYQRNHGTTTRTIINRDIQGKIIKKYLSNDISYDPRTRPWYLQAKKEKKTVWTNVYLFYFQQNNGLTVSSPVFKNGKFFGAFALDIDLSDLSQFINKIQKVTPNSYLFIVDKEGNLIASSGSSSFANLAKNTNIHSKSLINQTFKKYQQKNENKLLTFSYPYSNQTYMVTYVPSVIFATHGWYIGVITPQSDFISNLKKMNLITIYISLGILILGIFLISSLVSHIVKPLKILVVETENIKQFNLDNKIVIHSKIKEIIQLRNSVDSMKLGLKLFQKYIPKSLVRQLIESGEDIRTGGVRKTLTVLFSDIKRFTAIVEKMEPSVLMQQMGEYLEELSQIIIDEKGTIDKYIGDSIMAFWGAPLPNERPYHHAARAALRCQNKLNVLNKMWQQKGREAFITRIGIHMGDAIVGNLGSSERLNYTAIGDAINIASRLESINKNYGTKIIVSDTVYEIIKDQFILRMIDCVVVKGRTQSCYIYELLTDNVQDLEFDLNAYNSIFEQGFLLYKQQLWDGAIEHFKKCLEIYPADIIAPIFIERCQQFKSNPPKPGWQGITE